MANAHARLLFLSANERDQRRRVEAIVATHAAYMEALERVLGASPGSLYRADVEAVMEWVTLLDAADLSRSPERRRDV